MPPQTRSVTREFRTLSTALRNLASSFDRLAPMFQAGQHAPAVAGNGKATAGTNGKQTRKRPTLTPAWRRALVLHGRYLGSIRGLKPRQRAQVKKVRAAKGVMAAIAAARRMGG